MTDIQAVTVLFQRRWDSTWAAYTENYEFGK